jgi:hypothetical protein
MGVETKTGVQSESTLPCHYLFSLKVHDPTGGSSSAGFLEVESRDQVPPEATNVRAIREGEEIRVRRGFSRRLNWPIREIHAHGPKSDFTFEGYHWTSVVEKPLGLLGGIIWLLKHPLPPDGLD